MQARREQLPLYMLIELLHRESKLVELYRQRWCQATHSRGTRGPSTPTCNAASSHCGKSTLRGKGPLIHCLSPVPSCTDQQSASEMDF